MFCGKCGKEVPDGYEFCMSCGTKLESTTRHATEPIKNKKKWTIPVAVTLLIVLIASVAIYFINENKKGNGLYNDIPWQISYEELCKLMETKKTGEIEYIDEYQLVVEKFKDYKGNSGVNVIITYDCGYDGTLRDITLSIIGEDSEYKDSELFNKCVKEISRLYGKGETNSVLYSWETPKSLIRLTHISNRSLIIGYRDITYEEE